MCWSVEELYFSIVSEKMMVDLEAPDQRTKDAWEDGLNAILRHLK